MTGWCGTASLWEVNAQNIFRKKMGLQLRDCERVGDR